MESDTTHYFEPRVMCRRTDAGDEEFAIHEVYFSGDGQVTGYSEDALSPRETSIEKLRMALHGLLAEGGTTIATGELNYSYAREYIEEWLEHIDDPPLAFE